MNAIFQQILNSLPAEQAKLSSEANKRKKGRYIFTE